VLVLFMQDKWDMFLASLLQPMTSDQVFRLLSSTVYYVPRLSLFVVIRSSSLVLFIHAHHTYKYTHICILFIEQVT
jgi:hypothetical protein